jgi:ABC-type lipoprotein release transport system permease subunit
MKEYFKIAWRNLWRNKKRTIITIASVFFAVLLALMMRSMQLGSYDMMEGTVIKNSTGYIQVHKDGYWDDKTINNAMIDTNDICSKLEAIPNISLVVPRIETFALGSSGNLSKGVVVIGTDPETENEVSGLAKKIQKGEYLKKGDQGVLIDTNLAKFLKIDVGDSIVLLGQGYHGVTAAGIYPVRGTLGFPSSAMSNKLLYMDLGTAQYLYGADKMLTSVSIMLDKPKRLEKSLNEVSTALGKDYEVMSWREMNVELVQSVESDNISGKFMLGILYVVVGFGILGTMMMMTLERKREFGVMVSVGMQRMKLGIIIFLETVFIAVVGILSGIVAGAPLMYYLHINPIRLTGEAARAMLDFNVEPIMPFSLDPSIFYNQAIVVFVLTFIAIIYPLVIISRFNILKAMRGR